MLGLTGIRVPAGAEGLGAGGSKEPAVDLSVGITGEVSTSRRSPYPFIQFDVTVKTFLSGHQALAGEPRLHIQDERSLTS